MNPDPSSAVVKYPCSRGGAIAAGHRRLARLLIGLAVLLIAAALVAWVGGRIFPGLLAMAIVLVVATAWRMAGELQPRWLELHDGALAIQLARQRLELAIAGAEVRPLEDKEIRHLERLASAGGFVAGAGGFDSHLLGEFDLYASNLDNSLLVEASEQRLVVTPDRPGEFVTDFRQRASAAPARIHTP